MRPAEDLRFLLRRVGKDSPMAFACRIARFGLILAARPGFERRVKRGLPGVINGVRMMLPYDEQGIVRDLRANGIREPFIFHYLMSCIQPEWTVLDIGANQGYYALQEARLCRRVYAVEPVSASVARLRHNIERNGMFNISTYHLAIGDHNGTARMGLSRESPRSPVVGATPGRVYEGTECVTMRTVDSFIDDHGMRPDLIRMDVEGYEYEILMGAAQLLQSSQPLVLCVELHLNILGPCRARNLLNLLKGSGFVVT